MKLFAGTSGFAYKEWKGSFYPKDIAASAMLHFYGEHFNSVEVNNTFYQIPKSATVQAWAKEVSKDFRFAIKAPQRITHRKQLEGAPEAMAQLFAALAPLKKQIGPLLFQLPPWLKKDTQRLRDLLSLLPRGQRAAFEFRHQSWFDGEVFQILKKHKAALCIAEAGDDLKVPFVATADWGYLRLRRTDYSAADFKKWAARIRQEEWREAYVFFRHEDTGTGPLFARQFKDSFEKFG